VKGVEKHADWQRVNSSHKRPSSRLIWESDLTDLPGCSVSTNPAGQASFNAVPDRSTNTGVTRRTSTLAVGHRTEHRYPDLILRRRQQARRGKPGRGGTAL